jgi:hypothetical protein
MVRVAIEAGDDHVFFDLLDRVPQDVTGAPPHASATDITRTGIRHGRL